MAAVSAQTKPLTAADVVKLPSQAALAKIAYGSAPQQFAELRLPAGTGPFPVAVVIHGGCYGDYAAADYMAHLASALVKEGWATWNLEYRREHEEGGGWPGTFLDVGNGADALRQAAARYPLDLKRTVAMGHSAGGQLALWLAARRRLPRSSELYAEHPLPLKGVLSLAGIVDMRAFAEYGRGPCGERHIRVMGGTPAQQPARYAQVSPAELLPLGVPQVLVWGAEDRIVPESLFLDYERRARAAGDAVEVIVLPQAGHHDLNSAEAPGWPRIAAALRRLIA
ncbi:MAG: alpha/beta hydrolase [Acidobacteriia bacterium]|nr:alpha/beta hydrolase [Terriglobia bacterium]